MSSSKPQDPSNEQEPHNQDEAEKGAKTLAPENQNPAEDHVSSPPKSSEASFTTVDEKTRQLIHSKLKAYESRRRSTYTGKLESSSLYWRAFRDLLTASLAETGRAERLVLGTARANAAYANSMQASYEDVLVDDKGGLVMDNKKQEKLLLVRSSQDYALAPSKQRNSTTTATTNKTSPDERRTHMLSALIDAQAILADKFGDNAQQLESEIATELTQMRLELEGRIANIKQIGDAIIAELEATETEVAQAWDSYYAVANKVLSGERHSTNEPQDFASSLDRQSSVNKSITSSTDGEADIVEDMNDVWIVEMHYRVAVAYQSFAWEKASSELSRLFSSMKETECVRRMNVREYLVAFMQRQERLFVSLPDIHTPVLKELVGRDMDRATLEATVQTNIRKRAERLAIEEAKKKKEPDVPKSLEGANEQEGNFTLQSPLQSELMSKARVVERKGIGMISSWKLSLAVITKDGFLHLFDLPAGKVSLGTPPEIAFQTLTPKVQVPTTESLTNRKSLPPTTNFVKGWCDNLTPSESMVLPNCSISQPRSGREGAAFEIQEAIFNTGASKMFGKTTSTKKLTLRTINKKETQDWITALKSQK